MENTSPAIPPETAEYLQQITIPIRLSCATESGWPMIVSLWYLYEDGRFYCVTHKDARLVKYLEGDPRCAFEVAADDPPYCGVRGQARAALDAEKAPQILRRLLDRYLDNPEAELGQWLWRRRDEEVVICLEPVNLFTWNYGERMEGAVAAGRSHPCPPG